VATARLRLFNVGASDTGGVFSATSDASWTETGVTWDNAPAAVAPLVASLGAVGTNTRYEVDLSSLVRSDGVYSLRIATPSTDGCKVAFSGRRARVHAATGRHPAAVVVFEQRRSLRDPRDVGQAI
jgi:hypothetical protein